MLQFWSIFNWPLTLMSYSTFTGIQFSKTLGIYWSRISDEHCLFGSGKYWERFAVGISSTVSSNFIFNNYLIVVWFSLNCLCMKFQPICIFVNFYWFCSNPNLFQKFWIFKKYQMFLSGKVNLFNSSASVGFVISPCYWLLLATLICSFGGCQRKTYGRGLPFFH